MIAFVRGYDIAIGNKIYKFDSDDMVSALAKLIGDESVLYRDYFTRMIDDKRASSHWEVVRRSDNHVVAKAYIRIKE